MYLHTVDFFVHFIHIIAGCNCPPPWLKHFCIGNLWCNGYAVGLCEIKFQIFAACFCGRYYALCHLNPILVSQIAPVSSFLVGQNRMHNQRIIRAVDPDITGCVIPVTHISDCFFCQQLCFFFRHFTAFAAVIIMLYYSQRSLYLRFDLHSITICHCLFV